MVNMTYVNLFNTSMIGCWCRKYYNYLVQLFGAYLACSLFQYRRKIKKKKKT